VKFRWGRKSGEEIAKKEEGGDTSGEEAVSMWILWGRHSGG